MTPTDLAIHEPQWIAPVIPLEIETQEQFIEVAEGLKVVKEFESRVLAWFKPLKERAHAAWKGLTTRENETLAPAREWEQQCKQVMATYHTKQEEIRQAEERRLAEIARKQEEDRRLAEAAALEAEGIAEASPEKLAEAEEMLDAPVETPVVMLPTTTPKVGGISFRETWDARVVDLQKLIRHVAEHPELQNLLQPNLVALRAQARSLQDKLNIPGVKAYATKGVAAR